MAARRPASGAGEMPTLQTSTCVAMQYTAATATRAFAGSGNCAEPDTPVSAERPARTPAIPARGDSRLGREDGQEDCLAGGQPWPSTRYDLGWNDGNRPAHSGRRSATACGDEHRNGRRPAEAGSAYGDADRDQDGECGDEHHPSVVLDEGKHGILLLTISPQTTNASQKNVI